MSQQTLYVTSDHHGWRLEDFLADQGLPLDPPQIRRMLLAGSVEVDLEKGWLGRKMRSGERVRFEAEGPIQETRTDADVRLPLLHEDDLFVVVDKPAGIPVVPDRSQGVPSMIELLRASAPGGTYLVVHRIDKDASGAVVVARDRDAHRELSRQFEKREVHKQYLALVSGEPDRDDDVIELPIGHDPRDTMRMRPDRRAGKLSRTRYEVRERFRDYTLVEVFPETGRTHQIRVHMSGVGHALAIDPMYGSRSRLLLSELKPGYRSRRGVESPLMDRLTLHAKAVGFRHPGSGETVQVESPLHDDFALVLKMLRKYRPSRNRDEP